MLLNSSSSGFISGRQLPRSKCTERLSILLFLQFPGLHSVCVVSVSDSDFHDTFVTGGSSNDAMQPNEMHQIVCEVSSTTCVVHDKDMIRQMGGLPFISSKSALFAVTFQSEGSATKLSYGFRLHRPGLCSDPGAGW